MPLHDIPVVVPYRLNDDRNGVLYPLQIHTVASSDAVALATAKVLAQTVASIRHPGRPIQVVGERAKSGQPARQVDGPYAYVLTTGNHIHHLDFPARIDSQSGEVMGDAFAGLDPGTLHGVVMDCHAMTYINTAGLASIAGHAKRLHLRLFRVSEPVRRVFEIVGLTTLLRILPTLQAALGDLDAGHHAARNGIDQG
jgi:anti-anti-sigma regulatory factor